MAEVSSVTSSPGSRGSALLITPSFFGYEHAIADELRAQGFDTQVVDERPSNNSLAKAVFRVAPRLSARVMRRRLRRACTDPSRGAATLVLIVKGELVSPSLVRAIRDRHRDATVVYYAYDSFANSPSGRRLVTEVDHAFTFDPDDARSVDGLGYKPLFYSDEYHPRGSEQPSTYDVSFIGTLHASRYAVVQRALRSGVAIFAYFYSQARWFYVATRLLRPGSRQVPDESVHFVPVARTEVARVFRSSRAVIDIHRVGQSGLTMRTFEVLASGSRLITTNEEVRSHDFFDPRWVYVLPVTISDLDLASLQEFVSGTEPVPHDLVAEHSLCRWVAGIVSLVPAAVRAGA